jgi:2'-5' RNA ligase
MTEEVRDHWYWRPGWRPGRSFYTWHVTFTDQPAVARLFSSYRPVIGRLPGITPVPLEWLHLTMQGVGFSDRVDRREVDRIVAAARERCARLERFEVTIGPAKVDAETVQMPVRPAEPLRLVRRALRDAIGDVWGPDSIPETPEWARPHVSLGYWNIAQPAAPLVDVLAESKEQTAELTIRSVSLIDLNRDHQMYQWTELAAAALR